jgi:acyl-CoA thioesterase-2
MGKAFDGMLAALDLTDTGARTSEDIFTGESQWQPHGRVFGGQVLAQSVMAAIRTVDEDRIVHSMHGFFLRPGNAHESITFSVDRIHDGRSFSTRRSQAYQDGRPIFSMIASFQIADDGLDHYTPMLADVPDPDSLPNAVASAAEMELSAAQVWATDQPFEMRYVDSPIYFSVEGEPVAHQAVWFKSTEKLPDDPNLHRAALGYASDYTILESTLRAHGVPWATKGLKVASLDHAMWWHRFGRVDEWLLYVQESPNATGGRGLSLGRIYSRDGVLLASVSQEGMVRVPHNL